VEYDVLIRDHLAIVKEAIAMARDSQPKTHRQRIGGMLNYYYDRAA
jgi:hypothetical protein